MIALYQMVRRRKRFDDIIRTEPHLHLIVHMRTKLQLVQRLKLFITNLFAVLYIHIRSNVLFVT